MNQRLEAPNITQDNQTEEEDSNWEKHTIVLENISTNDIQEIDNYFIK